MILPFFKRFLYLSYLLCKAHWRERRRWHPVSSESPRVFYGHDYIPSPAENASGGIIKCQDLSILFPNTPQGANILYLVSSALPLFPLVMARYAKQCGVKVVVNQNGVAFPAYHGHRCETINRPRRRLLEMADYVIYQSQFGMESSNRFLLNYNGPSSVMHNPVNTSVFVPSSRKRDLRHPVLLMAGSHRHEYRVKSALQVLAQLRNGQLDARLRIAGRLAWEPSVEKCKEELLFLSDQLGVRSAVEFCGEYGQNDVVALFHGTDVLLHTQYMDCCPRLVVEAMACGLPVVYSASGGVPELVGNDAGIGIPVQKDWNSINVPDPVQMADGIVRIFESHDRYSAMAIKRAVERFDVKPWLYKHRGIFMSVLKS
jgi:glycosyltransferase involved in cell wall biosynthesis